MREQNLNNFGADTGHKPRAKDFFRNIRNWLNRSPAHEPPTLEHFIRFISSEVGL